jgi:hypothetical protein
MGERRIQTFLGGDAVWRQACHAKPCHPPPRPPGSDGGRGSGAVNEPNIADRRANLNPGVNRATSSEVASAQPPANAGTNLAASAYTRRPMASAPIGRNGSHTSFVHSRVQPGELHRQNRAQLRRNNQPNSGYGLLAAPSRTASPGMRVSTSVEASGPDATTAVRLRGWSRRDRADQLHGRVWPRRKPGRTAHPHATRDHTEACEKPTSFLPRRTNQQDPLVRGPGGADLIQP